MFDLSGWYDALFVFPRWVLGSACYLLFCFFWFGFAIPVPVRIWSEIWRFICDARGLCMGCLIFLGVFHVGCTGLFFSSFSSFGGWWYGKLAHCDFYLILDPCFFTIYLHMEMGRRTEAQNGMFLGFGYSTYNCFSLFFFPCSFRVGYDYNAAGVRVAGVCLLPRLYIDGILCYGQYQRTECRVLIYLLSSHLLSCPTKVLVCSITCLLTSRHDSHLFYFGLLIFYASCVLIPAR